jgi:hypothetical protein
MDKGQQMRFSDEELSLIKTTFKGNEKLLKLLRKVFLPEYDPQAPLGQTIDLWMTLDLGNLTPEEQRVRIHARNGLIMHIESRLIELNTLADRKEETPAEKKERMEKDSLK